MHNMNLKELAKKMADIDFATLTTRTDGGEISGRPMSNNRDVQYDGTSHYFALQDTRMVSDIERDPKVGLSFQGSKGLLGRPPVFVHVEGRAEIIRDKAAFAAHWNRELDHWFEQGIDTPGLVMLRVKAARITCWEGEDEADIPLAA